MFPSANASMPRVPWRGIRHGHAVTRRTLAPPAYHRHAAVPVAKRMYEVPSASSFAQARRPDLRILLNFSRLKKSSLLHVVIGGAAHAARECPFAEGGRHGRRERRRLAMVRRPTYSIGQ
jgi:hypothetical protein